MRPRAGTVACRPPARPRATGPGRPRRRARRLAGRRARGSAVPRRSRWRRARCSTGGRREEPSRSPVGHVVVCFNKRQQCNYACYLYGFVILL